MVVVLFTEIISTVQIVPYPGIRMSRSIPDTDHIRVLDDHQACADVVQ